MLTTVRMFHISYGDPDAVPLLLLLHPSALFIHPSHHFCLIPLDLQSHTVPYGPFSSSSSFWSMYTWDIHFLMCVSHINVQCLFIIKLAVENYNIYCHYCRVFMLMRSWRWFIFRAFQNSSWWAKWINSSNQTDIEESAKTCKSFLSKGAHLKSCSSIICLYDNNGFSTDEKLLRRSSIKSLQLICLAGPHCFLG